MVLGEGLNLAHSSRRDDKHVGPTHSSFNNVMLTTSEGGLVECYTFRSRFSASATGLTGVEKEEQTRRRAAKGGGRRIERRELALSEDPSERRGQSIS
jgi:hypothetical protein